MKSHLIFMIIIIVAVSWSSGRVQDSGLGSRSSPGFNTLPLSQLVVPLSEALHTALFLSTQEQMVTCGRRFVSHGAKLCMSACVLPRELRWISRWIYMYMDWKGPMTREGTCQSLQSRALSLDVDSKQWIYLYFIMGISITGPCSYFSESTDALLVSCGYHTLSVMPVLDGRLDAQYCRRINMGGVHLDSFMQRLLQLKYPGHLASLTLSRAEVRVHIWGKYGMSPNSHYWG